MSQSLAALLPFLQLVAAPAGAGAVTVALFNWLKRVFPNATLLHAPAFARYASIILAGLISVGVGALAAWLTEGNPLPAVDAAIAGMVGALASQLTHGLSLPATVPSPLERRLR